MKCPKSWLKPVRFVKTFYPDLQIQNSPDNPTKYIIHVICQESFAVLCLRKSVYKSKN